MGLPKSTQLGQEREVLQGFLKSYVLIYRFDGRKRLMTLARTSEASLEEIRRLAGELLVTVRQGRDPMEERKARREIPTIKEAMERYLDEHLTRRLANGRLSAGTLKEYRRQAAKYILPPIGPKRVAAVERRDIERLLADLAPVMANRVCALLSAFFNQLEHWELRPQHTNPARGIEKAREDERDRTLSPSELSALGKALDTDDRLHPTAVLAIRIAALTGLRIGEVLQMRWEDLDLERGLLILPTSKTGRRTHTLPSTALALLSDAPREGLFVIIGRDRDKPMDYSAVRRHWRMACDSAGIRDTRLHDLRRTIITEAAALGVESHLLRDMVGHKTTAMADRYARRAGAPLVELRERMGASMESKLGGLQKERDMPS
jgi:integrase